MAKWDAMVAAVEKAKGALASTQEFVKQLQQKVQELSQGMSDEEDQRKVDEFSNELNAIADQLPKAVVENPAPGTESSGGAP